MRSVFLRSRIVKQRFVTRMLASTLISTVPTGEHLPKTRVTFALYVTLLLLYARFILGLDVLIDWVTRSMEEQKRMVAEGKAETLKSRHVVGRRAIDLYIVKDGKLAGSELDYRLLGDFWKSLDPRNVWGGDWKKPHDVYHFQLG